MYPESWKNVQLFHTVHWTNSYPCQNVASWLQLKLAQLGIQLKIQAELGLGSTWNGISRLGLAWAWKEVGLARDWKKSGFKLGSDSTWHLLSWFTLLYSGWLFSAGAIFTFPLRPCGQLAEGGSPGDLSSPYRITIGTAQRKEDLLTYFDAFQENDTSSHNKMNITIWLS